MIRVVIADDHHLVREGIRVLLEKAPDIEVVGEAGDGRETVALVERLMPDVLLMDISMPHVNGIQALQRLKQLNLPTKTVILSMHSDEILVREAVQWGAKCYLLKGSVSDELLLAIRAAHRGAAYFSPAISDSIVAGGGPPETHGKAGAPNRHLTPREHEILRFISEGRTNNEIAKLVHISVKTVERHRGHLMAKLNAHNLVELIRISIKQRLIQFDDN
jgi:two-component system response regulator NreC